MDRADEYFKLAKQYQLGYDENGNDCEENTEKAIYYYKLAIDFGKSEAFYELGIIFVDEGNCYEAQSYFENALKSGIHDAYCELIEIYKQLKKWSEYLSLFFKERHNDFECKNAIAIVNYYYDDTIKSMDKQTFDVVFEFKKITNWLINSWCSNDLRKRLYKLREDFLAYCIYEKIESANTIFELNALEQMLQKCRYLINDENIFSKLIFKKIIFELNDVGIEKYESVLKKYEQESFYYMAYAKIIMYVAHSYLHGDNGVVKDIPRAISLISNHLALNTAKDFYNEVFIVINQIIEEKRYTDALTCLELLPSDFSFTNLKKKEVIESIEKSRIIELEKLPNNEIEKKIELAKIYLFSKISSHKNEYEGLKIAYDLFTANSSEEALLTILEYITCKNSNNSDNDNEIYELCKIAVEKGIKIPCPYVEIYEKVKAREEKKISDKKKIKDEVVKRNIQYLIHFTNADNIASIVEHGIISRKMLDCSKLEYKYTDEERKDYMRDYISTSITSPNKCMLEKAIEEKRIANPVLLFLEPSLLYDIDVHSVFYITNAATRKMQNRSGSDYESFMNMFSKEFSVELFDGVRPMVRLDKKDNETTDIQAEVLIKDKIPIKYIKKLFYLNEKKYKYIVNGKLVDYPL